MVLHSFPRTIINRYETDQGTILPAVIRRCIFSSYTDYENINQQPIRSCISPYRFFSPTRYDMSRLYFLSTIYGQKTFLLGAHNSDRVFSLNILLRIHQ